MRISALRFLYKRTLKRRDLAYDDLIFPKVPHKLPTMLSQDEVVQLIDAAPNRLYRMIRGGTNAPRQSFLSEGWLFGEFFRNLWRPQVRECQKRQLHKAACCACKVTLIGSILVFSKEVAVLIPTRIPIAAGRTATHQQLRDPLRPSRDPRPKARCTPRLRAQCQTHSACA